MMPTTAAINTTALPSPGEVRFLAIDFETANEQGVSACSVGVAFVVGEVVVEREWLLRPPEMRFSPFNIRVHGIRPERVAGAPAFPEVFGLLAPYFEGRAAWAHYAPFDQGVLNALFRHYRMGGVGPSLKCSCALARRTWPGHKSYGLSAVCERLGIALRHHHAASDAAASAAIVLAAEHLGAARSG